MADRDIGSMAENTLRLWASQESIVCNRVEQDKKGWDFHLQFRPRNEPPLPSGSIDLRPPDLSCWVQVKGVERKDAKAKRQSLKLSNWENLAKNPLPAFYLILEYGKGNDPVAAYLVHVDRDAIARVLKRLRKLEASDVDSIHVKMLDLKWGAANRLKAPKSAPFRATVERTVGPDPSKYFRQKQVDLSTVGYEAGRFRGKFRFEGGDDRDLWRPLVDFAIGLRPDMPIADWRVDEVRFGIPKPHSHGDDTKRAKLIHRRFSPTARADVIVRTEDHGESIPYTFDIFAPQSIFPFVPIEHTRMRYVAPFLEIIGSASGAGEFIVQVPGYSRSLIGRGHVPCSSIWSSTEMILRSKSRRPRYRASTRNFGLRATSSSRRAR
jgi:hypothetical protein